MRFLIDGYNLMHAAGLMAPRFGPNGINKARRRFLDLLANRLEATQRFQTTIVFDASWLPASQPPVDQHQGLTVIYAIEHEDADTRIEELIAEHSAPKQLTVVSSDRRLRKAAQRRRATSIDSDRFLDLLEAPLQSPKPSGPLSCTERARTEGPCFEEATYWTTAFADLEALSLLEDLPDLIPEAWSDQQIERIEAEVQHEKIVDSSFDSEVPATDWTDAELARIAREVASEDPLPTTHRRITPE